MTFEPIVDGDVTAIGRNNRIERLAVEILQFVDGAFLGNDQVHEEIVIRLGKQVFLGAGVGLEERANQGIVFSLLGSHQSGLVVNQIIIEFVIWQFLIKLLKHVQIKSCRIAVLVRVGVRRILSLQRNLIVVTPLSLSSEDAVPQVASEPTVNSAIAAAVATLSFFIMKRILSCPSHGLWGARM